MSHLHVSNIFGSSFSEISRGKIFVIKYTSSPKIFKEYPFILY